MRKSLVFALVITAGLGAFIYRTSMFRPAHNFHVVEEGKFYRSAQPTADELEDEVKNLGIKTVINLRGAQDGEKWYDDEANTLSKLGVPLINIGFSSPDMQFRDDWVRYLDALKTAPRPILIHCRSGADRTSEASAVYAMEYMHKSNAEALDMMTLRYLHVDYFKPAKRFFISHYEGENWLRTKYDPCDPLFKPYAGNRCPQN
jgi:protein tyrosine/serine phosphatase